MTMEQNIELIRGTSTADLLRQVMDRVDPVLTHKRKPSTMCVPPDFEHDDDVYVMTRLNELLIRLG